MLNWCYVFSLLLYAKFTPPFCLLWTPQKINVFFTQTRKFISLFNTKRYIMLKEIIFSFIRSSFMNTLFVVVLGLATVFIGLTIIIILCKIMSLLIGQTKQEAPQPAAVQPVSPAVAPIGEIKNKRALIVAISAAVAEELGADVSNIRIHSIKRV